MVDIVGIQGCPGGNYVGIGSVIKRGLEENKLTSVEENLAV